MKKFEHVLLIATAILIPSLVLGQQFGEPGTEWYYDESYASHGGSDYISFTSVKDTLFKGIECKLISKNGSIECLNRPSEEFIYTRNDTVFFYEPALDTFQILYDFSADILDSWTVIVPDLEKNIIITVDSTNYEEINGVNLKVLYVTMDSDDHDLVYSGFTAKIIERIGDISYFFSWWEFSIVACDVNWTRGLRCFQDPVIGFYSTGIAPSCDYTYTWIDSDQDYDNLIRVFPNPVRDFLDIQATGEGEYKAEIIGINGMIVKSTIFNSSIKMDLGCLDEGVYVLIIRNGDRICSYYKIMRLNKS